MLVEIQNEPLFRTRMEAVMPADHRLTEKDCLTAADLANEPLLGLWPNQLWRQQIDDFFRSGGSAADYVVETRSSLMACQLVRDGAGIALLDRVCAQAINLEGLALRPLEPERWMLFGYIHQRDRELSPNALTFLDCLRRTIEQFRQMTPEHAAGIMDVQASKLPATKDKSAKSRGSGRSQFAN